MSRSRPISRFVWLAAAVLLLGLAGWLLFQVPPGVNDEDATPRHAAATGASLAPARGNQPLPGHTNRTAGSATADGHATATATVTAQKIVHPDGRTIRLVAATIDTAADSDAGSAPAGLERLLATHPHEANWIVQLNGPVTEAWKSALVAAGCALSGYVPDNAFAVRADPAALRRAANLPFVRWIGPYDSAYRLAPDLRDARGEVTVELCTFTPADVAEAAAHAEAVGARVLARKDGPRNGRVRAQLDAARLPKLASAREIQWIERHHEAVLFNERAVIDTRLNVTNVWVAHELTGSNQIVAVADTGLDMGSTNDILPDFAGRVLLGIGVGRPGRWDDPHSHGTHVCGSVLGDGAGSGGLYRGAAWQAQLIIQSLQNFAGALTLPADLGDLFLQAYTNGARIHSDSWGSSLYGFYSTQSRDVDEFIWDHPDMFIAFAASNDGEDSNGDGVVDPDSIGSPGTAKNCLTVGASENERSAGGGTGLFYLLFGGASAPPLNFDNVSSPYDGVHQGLAAFSSRGPCDDGRVKPDIVAPGTDIISTRSRNASGTLWGVAPNTSYLYSGGTSMATPLSAGCAALFRQYLIERRSMTNPSAALIKAAMIAGARSLSPGQYGTEGYQEIPSGPRPNNAEGWGQIDVEGTLYPAAPLATAFIEGAPVATGETNSRTLRLGAGAPLRVALVWSDFPASAGSSKQLVNDLDLRVIGPNGVTNHPNGAGGPDRTNTVETIDIDGTTGEWRIEVVGTAVPQGPQPYSLVIRGPIAPAIQHTPHPNTTNTVDDYAIDATITSPAPIDTNQLQVLWNADGSQDFAALPMVHVSGDVYRASIPAQPLHTRVQYYLVAATNGLAASEPELAPSEVHAFDITTPVHLTIGAWPLALGDVSPAYGTATYASGVTIKVSAPAFAWTPALQGYQCLGWSGSGTVPPTGTTNELILVPDVDSTLFWQWQFTSFGLRQTSAPAGAVDALTWWSPGATGATVIAPAAATITGATHRFAGWHLDGQRVPDATSSSPNPVPGILMSTSHTASAIFLPAALDQDGDGLPDWWELLHFGSVTGASATADSDGDGFRNAAELSDETNPRDATSRPVPPVIVHLPLDNPQTQRAPFVVTATITDNLAVASAVLWWQRNAGVWNSTSMVHSGAADWTASIPPPGTNFDQFTYFILAADPGGRAAIAGFHAFDVAYPVIEFVPADLGTNWVAAGTTGGVTLTIANAGGLALDWSIAPYYVLVDEGGELGSNGWNVSGANAQWHPSTYRAYSGTSSWYCGSDASRTYTSRQDARLQMPSITPGSNAVLSFWSWLRCELDNGILAWDGGVIEVSTNGGASFFSVPPLTGYTHEITSNPDSPFPPNTPCLAGTGGWERLEVDLSAFRDVPTLIRFRFGSDGYVVDEGWYLDDIRVTSAAGLQPWITLTPLSGQCGPLATQPVQIGLVATAVPTGDYRGLLRVTANDLEKPETAVPLAMNVRYAPAIPVFAAQPRTNGSGAVLITQQVADADSPLLDLRIAYSVDGGGTWTNAALSGTDAGTIDNLAAWPLSGVPTGGVSLTWSSTSAPALWLGTATLLRATASDGHLTSAAAFAGPFLVDNIPPAATDSTLSVHSLFGTYAVGDTAHAFWTGFPDVGSGLAGVFVALVDGAGTTNGRYAEASPIPLSGLLEGQTNRVYAWARDAYGNIGAAIWTDVTPLSAAADADGDGFSNTDEELAGTSATNAASLLKLTGPLTEGSNGPSRQVVRWLHVTNRVYLLQFAPEPGAAIGATLTNPPVDLIGPYAVFALTNAPVATPNGQIRLGVSPP